jgi:hypothetical protein
MSSFPNDTNFTCELYRDLLMTSLNALLHHHPFIYLRTGLICLELLCLNISLLGQVHNTTVLL